MGDIINQTIINFNKIYNSNNNINNLNIITINRMKNKIINVFKRVRMLNNRTNLN